MITNIGTSIIENHFARNFELENFLQENNDLETLSRIRERYKGVNIYTKRASSNLSLLKSVYDSKKFINGEPFLLVLGDEIFNTDISCSKMLVQMYNDLKTPIIAVKEVEKNEVKNYGIVEGKNYKDDLIIIEKMMEKPQKGETHSQLAIIGRYILNASIFEEIEKNKDINFTEVLHNLKELKFALLVKQERFDCGSKTGLIKANIAMAMKNPQIAEEIKEYIKKLN